MGEPGNQDNRMQVIRIIGNQETGDRIQKAERWEIGRFSLFGQKKANLHSVSFKTKPICRRCKMEVSQVVAQGYEEKAPLGGMSEQSQTKPIYILPQRTLSAQRWKIFV